MPHINEEETLAASYIQLHQQLRSINQKLRAVEQEMLALKPLEEWKLDLDEGKIRVTNTNTHLYEVNDEPLRVLAENPHIPQSIRNAVLRVTPVSIRQLQGLAAYGSEERQLVEEALTIVGKKSRLAYHDKRE